ncbi:MAG TPA: hypothetical protein VEY12_02480 [Thermoplasmata archaeon]|nr:hypothetical protein [Thermoplasmata archaeon]
MNRKTRFTLGNAARGRARFTVAVAQSIHALIKANDAITMRFLGRRSTRHEDAAVLFGLLIRQNKIDPKFASVRSLLTRAIATKSDYDYKGLETGHDEAKKWIRDVASFLQLAKEILGARRS